MAMDGAGGFMAAHQEEQARPGQQAVTVGCCSASWCTLPVVKRWGVAAVLHTHANRVEHAWVGGCEPQTRAEGADPQAHGAHGERKGLC